MTRCIQEGNTAAIRQLHVVSTDVLRDTAGLTRNHIRITDVVQQRGLTVIDVTHHSDNRWTGYPILFVVILLLISLNSLNHVCTDIFGLETKLISHNIDRFRIQTLIDRNHDTNAHAGTDDLCHRHIHHVRQVIRSHELGQLQYLAFLFLLLQQLVLTLCCSLTFVTTILRALVILIALAGQTSQCLLNLLLYILLAHLCLYRFLQARATLITVVTLVAPLTILSGIAGIVCTGCIVDVHPILFDAFPLFLGITTLFRSFDSHVLCWLTRSLGIASLRLGIRLVTTKPLLLITLFALFLLGLLFGTSGLVQCVQVDFARDLDF